jgi:hypothetical protein
MLVTAVPQALTVSEVGEEHVWFPNMDKAVKAELDQCLASQPTAQPNPP